MLSLSEILNRPVAILGGGSTGKSIIKFLRSRGVEFTLFDEKIVDLDGIIAETDIRDASEFGCAVVSPGWRRDHKFVRRFLDSQVRVISELDFAWLIKSEIAPEQRWIALTGTNGKTTTIQMVQSILDQSTLNGLACGNVGEPVTSALMREKSYEILALELSSFQIDWSELPEYEAVAVLNIAEDHIDWHGSFDAYANAKMKILESSNVAVLNGSDPEVVLRSSAFVGKKVLYSLETPSYGELGLVEEILVDRAFGSDPSEAAMIAELKDIKPAVPHNVSNALAASGLALAIGISHEDIRSGLQKFTLDHHRLELVLEQGGVRWINDSKATNPHAAIAGILSNTSVIWIAGGLAKGAKVDELVKRAAPRLKAAILIGTDRELFAEALAKYAPNLPQIRIDISDGIEEFMDEIVRSAQKYAAAGDAVLLAPACASMDQFVSYAHRGELFASSVQRIVAP